jgi:hypothetical protein
MRISTSPVYADDRRPLGWSGSGPDSDASGVVGSLPAEGSASVDRTSPGVVGFAADAVIGSPPADGVGAADHWEAPVPSADTPSALRLERTPPR